MKKKLIHKLTIQIIIVVIIIAEVFSALISMQTKELEKRISDKAELFAAILGANLDNIMGNNLIAYNSLQEKVEKLITQSQGIEGINIIDPEGIVIASSSPKQVGFPIEVQYEAIIKDVLANKSSRAIVKTVLGRELVFHFLPIFSAASDNGRQKFIGILQLIAVFPSQQGELVTALRKNRNFYFKEEALRFAKSLSNDLEIVLAEVNRNSGYLDRLIQNILADEEIKDVKLYLKDLRFLISASKGRNSSVLKTEKNDNYVKAMKTEVVVKEKIKGQEQLDQIISPLYLTLNQSRQSRGAVGIVISLKRVHAVIASRRNLIILMSVIIICAFILIIGLFFKNAIITPLQNFVKMSAKIGKGDFSQKVDVSGDDEISTLGKAFNQMSVELSRSKAEIEQWNKRLQERVDIISNELKSKQEQLIESEKMASLGLLSSGIAHEINNPLGIILGHTQMLLKELKDKKTLADPQEAQKLLETVENYTHRCTYIVNSLLQFASKKQMQLVDTHINLCVENALLFTEKHITEKKIKIDKDLAADLPQVQADAIHLEQVFINILLNAQRSMPKGGEIKIMTKFDGKNILTSFEDTGVGIPEENMGKIFEPFFSTRETGKGSGLGLSISYGIIKAHNGDIKIESKEGEGTTVIVEIPITKRRH